jgi:hypothetical protein
MKVNTYMKTTKVLFLVFVLAGCNRQDSEVVKLQREVEALKLENLKSASKTTVEVVKPPEEYKRFMAAARRLNAALGASVEWEAFNKSYIELMALYQELPAGPEKNLVTDYFLAIDDAHSLWVYKTKFKDGPSGSKRKLSYTRYEGVPGSQFLHYTLFGGLNYREAEKLLGNRWSNQLADLIPRYNINMNGGESLDIDEVLPKVLDYSMNAFRRLEKM